MMKVTSQRAMCQTWPKKATHGVRMSDLGKNISASEDVQQKYYVVDMYFLTGLTDALRFEREKILKSMFLQHVLESLFRSVEAVLAAK